MFLFWTLLGASVAAGPIRIKDLVDFDGVRGNDLVGYGLVVGLNGTGDGLRNAPFTEEIMTNILERLGVNVTGEQFRPKNVAAVFVTASLPPFARAGSQIDTTVSAIGDASSLLGGTLIMTPLNAADGQIYAVAQGTIIAGGAVAEGDGANVTQGVPTSGVIPSGARIEREIDFELRDLTNLRLALRDADFTTAARIEQAINADFGREVATMLDSGTVTLNVPATRMPSVAHALGAHRKHPGPTRTQGPRCRGSAFRYDRHGRRCPDLARGCFAGQPDLTGAGTTIGHSTKSVCRRTNRRRAQN